MDAVNNSLIKGTMLISNQFGIVNHVSKLPRLNYDPKLVSFGIWPSNTLAFGAEKEEVADVTLICKSHLWEL